MSVSKLLQNIMLDKGRDLSEEFSDVNIHKKKLKRIEHIKTLSTKYPKMTPKQKIIRNNLLMRWFLLNNPDKYNYSVVKKDPSNEKSDYKVLYKGKQMGCIKYSLFEPAPNNIHKLNQLMKELHFDDDTVNQVKVIRTRDSWKNGQRKCRGRKKRIAFIKDLISNECMGGLNF
jgi:hypothetical protein